MTRMIDIESLFAGARTGFTLTKTELRPDEEAGDETLFTLCNGRISVRGAVELASTHAEPASFRAGLFDKPDRPAEAPAFGLVIRNKAITPALAIVPEWHGLEIEVEGRPFDMLNCEVLSFERTLDMYRGLLFSDYRLRSDSKTVRVRTMRMVSKVDLNLTMFSVEVGAEDFSGNATIRFVTSTATMPGYIPRLRDYISKTDFVEAGATQSTAFLCARVSETLQEICLASRTMSNYAARIERRPNAVLETFTVPLSPEAPFRADRISSFQSTLDCPVPKDTALEHVAQACAIPVETHVGNHADFWAAQWPRADVAIDGDADVQLGVRWDIFQLMQMGNPADPNVSISATGLHGQGYFGHVFWDTEVYLVPFYLSVDPAAARNLLRYRFDRLEQARQNARDWGFEGARFPWTSTSTGLDVTPPDWPSSREVHVSGAVALAFRRYLDWTGDYEFFMECGIEVIAETARFWASRVTRSADGKYHLIGIVGPDEYNTKADDNYYTMHLASWNMREAVHAMRELRVRDEAWYRKLGSKLQWNDALEERLEEICGNLAFPRTRDNVCEQCAGFFEFTDAPITKRGRFNMPIVEHYGYEGGCQRSKQADVVMMHYLFENDFSHDVKQASYDYYDARCTQGSSLSPAIYCIMGLKLGRPEHAYGYFQLTALLDLQNLHLDKNLNEGIHAACAGGTWMAAMYGYAGVAIRNDVLTIAPRLPAQWKSLSCAVRFRQSTLFISADHSRTAVRLEGAPVNLLIHDKTVSLTQGSEMVAVATQR